MSPLFSSAVIKADSALYAVLWPQKDALAKRWIDIVHGTYPFETIGFLRTRKDQFANPVGHRTEAAAAEIMDMLFAEQPDQEKLTAALDDIIRVRAIQNFSAETAVGVIFALKDILREAVEASGQMAQCYPALFVMESRIDAVALLAFGIYARCRESLHQMKVDEFMRKHSQILRMAQRMGHRPDEEAEHNNP